MVQKHRQEQEYLSRLDGARMLGIAAKTWDRLSKGDGFPKPVMVANKVHLKRWRKDHIEDWLQSRSPQPDAKPVEEKDHDGDNPIIDS